MVLLEEVLSVHVNVVVVGGGCGSGDGSYLFIFKSCEAHEVSRAVRFVVELLGYSKSDSILLRGRKLDSHEVVVPGSLVWYEVASHESIREKEGHLLEEGGLVALELLVQVGILSSPLESCRGELEGAQGHGTRRKRCCDD